MSFDDIRLTRMSREPARPMIASDPDGYILRRLERLEATIAEIWAAIRAMTEGGKEEDAKAIEPPRITNIEQSGRTRGDGSSYVRVTVTWEGNAPLYDVAIVGEGED